MKERISIPPPAAIRATTPSVERSAPLIYTLRELVVQHGSATAADISARFAPDSIGPIVAEGQRLSTARLVRGASLVLGAATSMVAQLLPEQRDLLPGLDASFLRDAVATVHLCEQRGDLRGDAVGSAGSTIKGHRSRRDALAKRAQAQRAIAYATANSLSGADPADRARLDEAWGSGDSPEHCASSLLALTVVLRELVARAKASQRKTSVTEAWIEERAALAAELTAVTECADTRAFTGSVAQGDVAWWRGAAIWFIRQMADMVDAAHAADPRIARLPLGELRPMIRHPRGKKKKSASPKGEAPATPAAATPVA